MLLIIFPMITTDCIAHSSILTSCPRPFFWSISILHLRQSFRPSTLLPFSLHNTCETCLFHSILWPRPHYTFLETIWATQLPSTHCPRLCILLVNCKLFQLIVLIMAYENPTVIGLKFSQYIPHRDTLTATFPSSPHWQAYLSRFILNH